MSNYPKDSVIDIAMGIMSTMDPRKVSINTPSPVKRMVSEDKQVSDFVPDISDTTVGEDYITSILEGSMGVTVDTTKKKPIKEIKKQPQTNLTEEKVNDLIFRLSSLLNEARQMIDEMTTVGMIGGPRLGRKLNTPMSTPNRKNKKK